METEKRILEAAEREFLNKGFAGARTTSIASAAGVTHAMFHYYFRTKEKIFNRIISDKINLLKEILLSSICDFDLPLDILVRNIIDSHLEFISANPDLPRFILGEIYNNPERAELFTKELERNAPAIISFLQTKIDDEASRGLCRKLDAKMLLLDIASLNIFAFLAAPVVNAALSNCMMDAEHFLTVRKKENYDTIIRKLKP